MKLAPYPEYKDSGQPFLGEIPAHWSVFRNGRLFSQRNDTGFGDLPILEVSLKTGVRMRDMDNLKRKQVMSDREKYKRAARGDIAYNMMRMWQGAVGVVPVDGLVSPAYVVVRPFWEVNCRYFSYLFRTASYMNEVDAYSRGIVKDRNRLYWQDFKRMPSPVPPIEEQRHISRFLDALGSEAQRFMRNKRRLIELLKEQRKNIINRAVTQGLDPSVAFRPSGVEWIGNVPEHWEVSRVKREFHCLNNQRIPLSATERGEMKSRLYDYYGASGVIDKVEAYIYDDELILIAEDGANLVLRNLQLAMVVRGKFWVNNHAHILKPKSGNIEFLAHCLEQVDYRPWISGAAQPKLTKDRLMAITIAIPPRGEQDEIVGFIKQETATIDYTITRTEREIKLMREYRARLISDVVTGQVDVRGIEVQGLTEEGLLALAEDTGEPDDGIDDEGDMDDAD